MLIPFITLLVTLQSSLLWGELRWAEVIYYHIKHRKWNNFSVFGAKSLQNFGEALKENSKRTKPLWLWPSKHSSHVESIVITSFQLVQIPCQSLRQNLENFLKYLWPSGGKKSTCDCHSWWQLKLQAKNWKKKIEQSCFSWLYNIRKKKAQEIELLTEGTLAV